MLAAPVFITEENGRWLIQNACREVESQTSPHAVNAIHTLLTSTLTPWYNDPVPYSTLPVGNTDVTDIDNDNTNILSRYKPGTFSFLLSGCDALSSEEIRRRLVFERVVLEMPLAVKAFLFRPVLDKPGNTVDGSADG
jgi:hypothetical protein